MRGDQLANANEQCLLGGSQQGTARIPLVRLSLVRCRGRHHREQRRFEPFAIQPVEVRERVFATLLETLPRGCAGRREIPSCHEEPQNLEQRLSEDADGVR